MGHRASSVIGGGFESQLEARLLYKDISNLAVELTGTAKESLNKGPIS